MTCMSLSSAYGSSYSPCTYGSILSYRRTDDFAVVMALGDSITAGLFARPSKLPDHYDSKRKPQHQKPFKYSPDRIPLQSEESDAETLLLPGFEEYRGRSYATGADLGAVTIPNVRNSLLETSAKTLI